MMSIKKKREKYPRTEREIKVSGEEGSGEKKYHNRSSFHGIEFEKYIYL